MESNLPQPLTQNLLHNIFQILHHAHCLAKPCSTVQTLLTKPLLLILLPEQDGSDSSAATFVDSDGQVSSTDSMRLLNASRDYDSSSITNVTDGAWHMITLTTMPVSGVHGYLLYVDGEYTGSLPSPSGGTPTGMRWQL